MAIAPGAELLDDPCGESGGGIIEAVGERLRLGALNPLIAAFGGAELLEIAEEHFFLGRKLGRMAALGGADRNHVQMNAVEIRGIDLADAGGDRRAPIAALDRIALEA